MHEPERSPDPQVTRSVMMSSVWSQTMHGDVMITLTLSIAHDSDSDHSGV